MVNRGEKDVLQDHKRIGKRFIPPFATLPGQIKEVSFVKMLFPHLIWMGFVNDRFGYEKGVRLSIDLAKTAHSALGGEKHINFALSGSYLSLSSEAKAKVLRECEQKGCLKDLQRALAPLTLQYDGFPMAFLGIGDFDVKRDALLQELKSAVEKCINKYETPGLVLQTNLIMVQAATGGLRISKEIELPDLDSIIKAPESEAAKRAAAFVRAGSFAMCMPDDQILERWSKSFWNQGYKVDSCSFLEDGNG